MRLSVFALQGGRQLITIPMRFNRPVPGNSGTQVCHLGGDTARPKGILLVLEVQQGRVVPGDVPPWFSGH